MNFRADDAILISKGKSVYSVDEVEDIPVLAAIVRDAVEYAGN